MRSTVFLTLLATAGFAAAQEQYNIDPNSVDQKTRDYWCQMAQTQCPLICLQQPGVTSQNTIKNDCSPKDLSYACVCDNNVSPNVTMYTQTIPFFKCQEWGTQCRNKCNGDGKCADKCTADHPCGATEPFKGNATKSASPSNSATQSSKPGSTSIAPAFGGSGDSSNRNAASSLSTMGAPYGLAVTVLGIFAGVALL